MTTVSMRLEAACLDYRFCPKVDTGKMETVPPVTAMGAHVHPTISTHLLEVNNVKTQFFG
jgi:hypothetical protein